VQGKISVLFGAISIVAFGVVMAAVMMIPQSAAQTQTNELQEAVNIASRRHVQVLGQLAGPIVTVGDKLPPNFEEGTEANIKVLGITEQNTAIPGIIDGIQKGLKDAITAAPEANAEAKAAAYALMGQVLSTKADYYLQSSTNASSQVKQLMSTIDRGILSAQRRLGNIKQIEPRTKVSEDNNAAKMKSDADAKLGELKTAVAAQEAVIADLTAKRKVNIEDATKHNNDASALRTRSALAVGEDNLKLQEEAFAKEKLAISAALDAEDNSAKIDEANAALAMLNLQLKSAQSASDSAAAMLAEFATRRKEAKGTIGGEIQTVNAAGAELTKNAEAMMEMCGKIDAAQALAMTQYTSALEAIASMTENSDANDPEAISAKANILLGQAWASVSTLSLRQSVGATGVRLQSLWERLSIEGEAPKITEMAAFANTVEAGKADAGKKFGQAAALYQDATSKADQYKWSYQRRELQARKASHWLTGNADDQSRVELLQQQLSGMKGFPYTDKDL
jgi:hypothetical protein